MTRSRPQPWLYRWSRPIIGAIATLGVVNTAYLTYQKFTASACPTETCAVLASRYATVFGQPLSLFGLMAYFAIAVFALLPLLLNKEAQLNLRRDVEDKTWWALFVGSTGMLLFSGYLMYIMFSEFILGGRMLGWAGVCPFCLFSAICAAAIFALTLLGRDWEEIGPMLMSGIVIGMVTLVGTLAVYAPDPNLTAQGYAITDGNNKAMFYVDNQSGESEIALAKHLKETGAMIYTSYTCPHCCEQKQLFGQQATPEIPHTECNPRGKDAKPDICQQELTKAAEISRQPGGYPMWKIKDKYYFGWQKLPELAKYSGYTGPQSFKNEPKTCTPVS